MPCEAIASGRFLQVLQAKQDEIPLTGVRWATCIDKEDQVEFMGFLSSASSISAHMSPYKFSGSHSFLINAFTLTKYARRGKELSLHCYSTIQEMRLCFICSVATEGKDFFLGRNRSFHDQLDLGI